MDNIIAIQAAVNNLEAAGTSALPINYVKALVTKGVEQQHAHYDSQGQMYSRSTASRAASSAARHAGERTVANVHNSPNLSRDSSNLVLRTPLTTSHARSAT
jgi:hypothetical protein